MKISSLICVKFTHKDSRLMDTKERLWQGITSSPRLKEKFFHFVQHFWSSYSPFETVS